MALSRCHPVPRDEFVDAADRVLGDPREDVSQPSERVDAAQFAGFNQAIDGGGAGTSGIGTGKQPILSAQADAPQRVFGAVVVDLQPTVVREAGECGLVSERVTERLGEPALRRQPAELGGQPAVQACEQRLALLLPNGAALVGRAAADRRLDAVKLGDPRQGAVKGNRLEPQRV